MQAFVDFLSKKLGRHGDTINVSDLDDHHLRLEVRSHHERVNGNLADDLLIPLMTRFLLISTNCDPDPSVGITVQKINSQERYVIVMRQIARDNRFIITISITVVLP